MLERRCDIEYARTAHEHWDPLGERRREERALLFEKERRTIRAVVSGLLNSSSFDDRSPILEVACGQGRITQVLEASGNGLLTVALDLSPQMMDLVRRHTVSISPAQGDALRIPFADNSFQLTVAVGLTMHIPNLEALLRELKRVSLPQGRIIFNACNPYSVYSLWRMINPFSRRPDNCPPQGYSTRQVRDCVAKVGLNLDDRYGVGAVFPLSLLSDWRGLIVNGTTALRLSDVLDPTAANRLASDQIFVCSKKA